MSRKSFTDALNGSSDLSIDIHSNVSSNFPAAQQQPEESLSKEKTLLLSSSHQSASALSMTKSMKTMGKIIDTPPTSPASPIPSMSNSENWDWERGDLSNRIKATPPFPRAMREGKKTPSICSDEDDACDEPPSPTPRARPLKKQKSARPSSYRRHTRSKLLLKSNRAARPYTLLGTSEGEQGKDENSTGHPIRSKQCSIDTAKTFQKAMIHAPLGNYGQSNQSVSTTCQVGQWAPVVRDQRQYFTTPKQSRCSSFDDSTRRITYAPGSWADLSPILSPSPLTLACPGQLHASQHAISSSDLGNAYATMDDARLTTNDSTIFTAFSAWPNICDLIVHDVELLPRIREYVHRDTDFLINAVNTLNTLAGELDSINDVLDSSNPPAGVVGHILSRIDGEVLSYNEILEMILDVVLQGLA